MSMRRNVNLRIPPDVGRVIRCFVSSGVKPVRGAPGAARAPSRPSRRRMFFRILLPRVNTLSVLHVADITRASVLKIPYAC